MNAFALAAVLFASSWTQAQSAVADKSEAIELAPKLDRAKGRKTSGYKACRKDIARLCKGVRPGQERLAQCLFRRFERLSAACTAFADHAGPERRLASLPDIDRGSEIRR